METTTAARVLAASSWRALQSRHEARVDRWLTPHLERRRRGVGHPVEDFLFTYYTFRPAALRRWHPGFGTALLSAPEYAGFKGYGDVAGGTGVTADHVARQEPLLRSVSALLRATASRPPTFGCFGMHEWAMVYRLPQDSVRHSAWPLRLGPARTDEVVENHRIGCSHFDAFRFFTPAARPLNQLSPAADNRPTFEQPGCLHAGMDLYKNAFRLLPMVSSELVADCFSLARDIRVLDMRASPYDLTVLGYEPIAIETPAGKHEYVDAQRRFTERAAPLRSQLTEECERLLAI